MLSDSRWKLDIAQSILNNACRIDSHADSAFRNIHSPDFPAPASSCEVRICRAMLKKFAVFAERSSSRAASASRVRTLAPEMPT
jgi:hypothetical protein